MVMEQEKRSDVVDNGLDGDKEQMALVNTTEEEPPNNSFPAVAVISYENYFSFLNKVFVIKTSSFLLFLQIKKILFAIFRILYTTFEINQSRIG